MADSGHDETATTEARAIGHQLSNLLMVIQIDAKELAEEGSDAGRRILEAANEIRGLLDKLRPSQAVAEASLEFAIDDKVDDTLPLLFDTVGDHVALEFAPGCGAATISGNPELLQHALIDLVRRAADRLESGTLELTSRRDAKQGAEYAVVCLHLAVDQPQGDLSLARSLVEPLGADIVWATTDSGSEIGIWLPLGTATAEPVDSEPEILIVEDFEPLRNIISRALEQSGFRVHQARGVQTAHKLWKRHGPAVQLLVTDIAMPSGDGTALALELRQSAPELKVLFISGTLSAIDQLPPDTSLLRKPFRLVQLVETVRSLLDQDLT